MSTQWGRVARRLHSRPKVFLPVNILFDYEREVGRGTWLGSAQGKNRPLLKPLLSKIWDSMRWWLGKPSFTNSAVFLTLFKLPLTPQPLVLNMYVSIFFKQLLKKCVSAYHNQIKSVGKFYVAKKGQKMRKVEAFSSLAIKTSWVVPSSLSERVRHCQQCCEDVLLSKS